MSDQEEGATNRPFKIPKNRPGIGNLSEMLASAKIAGQEMGVDVPTIVSGADVVTEPRSPEVAPRRSAPQGREAAPKKTRNERREMRLRLSIELIARARHRCVDESAHFSDLMERALEQYLKRSI
ncbi:hypothetical protein BA190_07870 [Labrys sp. WJW]|uniref:hypothetical protein n=1 Tax=Labrys sp. WJW TaxID=1737983 RepID=UPI000834C2C5|nr:hypothetical protein [Labrys sp. WJW]OCC05347.1 hypothetical protein BA190_07870 [Labrys sp. WJW]